MLMDQLLLFLVALVGGYLGAHLAAKHGNRWIIRNRVDTDWGKADPGVKNSQGANATLQVAEPTASRSLVHTIFFTVGADGCQVLRRISAFFQIADQV